MSNAWDFLDGLVGAAATVISSKNAAEAAANTQNDQTAVRPVATAQVAFSGGQMWLYVGIGVAVLVGAVILLRKR